jgi:RimJ/RimL family protein N-acetyltransferase
VIREKSGEKPLVGISDIRLNHPQVDEATIELLLIDQSLQNQGYGHEALQAIEQMVFEKVRLVRLGVDLKNNIAKDFWEKENYTSTRNPFEPGTRQYWYAKSRNWYERIKARIFSYG